MTKLCLGTVQFGMNYGIQGNGQPNLEKAVEILTTAYNAGIVTYDTAAAYGSAEHVLNTFLSQPGIEREKILIISKTQSADSKIINDAQCSLKNLGINYLDGCLLHDANLVFNAEAVQNLEQLKEKGIARKVGVSVYTPEQAQKCLDYDYVDIIQVPYNILDRRLDKCDFFTRAKEIGLDVYVRSVLLQGLLMMDPETLPVHMIFAESYLRKYQNICDENGIGYFDCAVGYVLEHPDIDYIVFGVDNLTQLNQYINLYSDLDRSKRNIGEMFGSVFDNVEDKVIMPYLWK